MKERAFEIILTRNVKSVFGQDFKVVAQQLSCPAGRIDFLISNGALQFIIEVKRGRANNRAVDQVNAYVDHFRSIGEAVSGWIVAHEIPEDVANYADGLNVAHTAVSLSECAALIEASGLTPAALSGTRIEKGVVRGGGPTTFGKNAIPFETALGEMNEDCRAFFKDISTRRGVVITSGKMQTTIVYKGIKIGGLRRRSPVFFLLTGLMVDDTSHSLLLDLDFQKKIKLSKNDHHQHAWYEIQISKLHEMRSAVSFFFRFVDGIFDCQPSFRSHKADR